MPDYSSRTFSRELDFFFINFCTISNIHHCSFFPLECIEKEKENRPQSTKEIISMLEKCEDYLAWTPSNAEKWWGKNSDDNNAVDEEASTQIEHTIQIKLS